MTNKSESQHKRTRQMASHPPFHQRFNIKVENDETRERFLNRVSNRVVNGEFFSRIYDEAGEEGEELKYDIMWEVANSLGEIFSFTNDLDDYVSGDFYACLRALEVVYQELPKDDQKKELDEIIQIIMSESEIDLGVRWKNGAFWKSGAKLLDESLVNEPLQWLSDPKYHNVLAPFQKGLSHFIEANKQPEKLSDTITDMYEALEAMAKVATGKPKRDLSGNAELFISKLGLSDYYKKMLKDYISYANEFRHAIGEGKERVPPLTQEVEAFIYTTGLFIRLAIERLAVE